MTTRKSRYCFSPCAAANPGMRITIADRVRRFIKRHTAEEPDVRLVVGYYRPVYPGK